MTICIARMLRESVIFFAVCHTTAVESFLSF